MMAMEESPRAEMEMTEVMPMIMPSMVRKALILLDLMLKRASLRFSMINMVLPPSLIIDDATIAESHDTVGVLCNFPLMGNDDDGFAFPV